MKPLAPRLLQAQSIAVGELYYEVPVRLLHPIIRMLLVISVRSNAPAGL